MAIYSRRTALLISKAVALGIIVLYPSYAVSKGAQYSVRVRTGKKEQRVATPDNPIWSTQIDFTQSDNIPWSASDFAAIAQDGMNRVEINLDWGDIEPQKGHYDFRLLDRYMAAAAKAHLKLYLLFWESVWGGAGKNPPPWLTVRDVTSDGVPALEPPWWDPSSRRAYFDYVAHTIDRVKGSPGFGGVYASYGWLDSEWGPQPKGSHGVTGYAAADIRAFYRWLPRAYKSLAAFNQRWHTSYDNWSRIPVPRPGDRLFAVYQNFRHYSVVQAYSELSSLVRAHTNAPMFYYWGGDICGRIGPEVEGNDPDTFFQIAKKYHAIINLDDVDHAGLALLFSSLARSYRVPLLNEWTPWRKDLRPEIPQWLGHIGLAAPYEVGEDFFIYPPPSGRLGFRDAWAAYREWHVTLCKLIQGETPEQPVAVLVPTRNIAMSTNLDAFADLTQQLRDFWRHYYVLPHFITDQQVAQGIVRLEQFRAVIDLGHDRADLPALKTYAEKHPISDNLDQALTWLQPYLTLEPPFDSLEAVPTVDKSSVWLTLANCNGQKGYSGSITFDPKALGLNSVSPDVKDAKTHRRVPAIRISGDKIRWRIDLPPGGLQVLRLALAGRSR